MDESRVTRLAEDEIARLGTHKASITAYATDICEGLIKDTDKDCVVFPSNAKEQVRKICHKVAETMGLKHFSVEKDGKRRLVICKEMDPSKLFNPDPPKLEISGVTRNEIKVKLAWTYEVKAPVHKVTLTFSPASTPPSLDGLVHSSKHGTAVTNSLSEVKYAPKDITGRCELIQSQYLTVILDTDADHLMCEFTFANLEEEKVYEVTAKTEHEGASSESVKKLVLTLGQIKGKLRCWGNNSQGAFGFICEEEVVNKPIDFQSDVGNIVVSQFSAGYCHGTLVSELGSLVTWGRLVWTEPGSNTPQYVPSLPLLLSPSTPTKFVLVSCGDTHNLALSSLGQVFSWGLGNVGELGLGDRSFSQSPEPIEKCEDDSPQGQFFVGIACSQLVSIAVTKDGAVFEWGFVTHPADPLIPIVLPRPKYVKPVIGGSTCVKVSAGSGYKAVVLKNKELYMWGQNMAGVLGNGTTLTASCPTKVVLPEVVGVSCGATHVAAITSEGGLATWGRGDKGQLAHGDYQNSFTPRLVDGLSRVSMVSCNGNHTMVIMGGELWTCGEGKNGCLGIGVKGKAGRLMRVKGEGQVMGVAAGVMHSLAVFR